MKTYAYAALAAVSLLALAVIVLVLLSGGPERPPPGWGEPGSGALSAPGAGELAAPQVPAPSPLERPGPTEPPREGSAAGSQETPPPRQEPRPLEPGPSALAVVVLDGEMQPIESASVTLRSGLSAAQEFTDAAGEAWFRGIAPGIYSFVLEAPGRPPLASARQVQLLADEEKRLVVQAGSFDLAISGRVLDASGAPLAGIEVVAIRHLVRPGEDSLLPLDQTSQSASSGADGGFVIAGLEDGEYDVRTAATERYPSVGRVVRAGAESVDLFVRESLDVRVFGRVSDAEGRPLAKVGIIPLGQSARAVESLEDGSYELLLAVTEPDRIYTIRYLREGFREARREVDRLPATTSDEEPARRIDVELEPLGETVAVLGTVRTTGGEPVEGEVVNLHSQALGVRYEAASAADGSFELSGVQVGEDYRLWIHPRGPFQDVAKHPLAITAEGLDLQIELPSLGTGRLSGRMVDPEGKPLGGYSLWLRSTRASARSLEVISGPDGNFVVDDAPEGRLVLETRSLPRIVISGISLEPGERKDVALVIDRGEHELRGRVADEQGRPIAGAGVYLAWTHQEGGVRSSSTHRTLSDADGLFRFTQLGAGEHRLSASAAGYRSVQLAAKVDARGEILDVRLRSLSP